MKEIIDLIFSNFWYYLLGLILVIGLIDIYTSFRYYYFERYYDQATKYLDLKRLEYLRRSVVSGYRILASEKTIKNSLEKVRELEIKLEEAPMDFSEHEEKYKKELKDVLKRGYL